MYAVFWGVFLSCHKLFLTFFTISDGGSRRKCDVKRLFLRGLVTVMFLYWWKKKMSRHRYEQLKQLSRNRKKVNLSHHIGWRRTVRSWSCFFVLSSLIKLGHAGLIRGRNCQRKGHCVFVEHVEGTQHNPDSHDTTVDQPRVLAPHVNMLIFTTDITHCYTLALPRVITFTWHFNCHLFNSVPPNVLFCADWITHPYVIHFFISNVFFFFCLRCLLMKKKGGVILT